MLCAPGSDEDARVPQIRAKTTMKNCFRLNTTVGIALRQKGSRPDSEQNIIAYQGEIVWPTMSELAPIRSPT